MFVCIYTRYRSVFRTIFKREKMKDIFTARQAQLLETARGDRAQKGKPVAGKCVGAMTQKRHRTTNIILIVNYSRVEGAELNQWMDLQKMSGEIAPIDSDGCGSPFL